MALIWVLLGIVVLGGVAVVASGRGEGLLPAQPDRPDVALPPGRPVGRADVDAVRFSVGLRGYRMDEVDDVLDRVSEDLAERDARIAMLEQQLAQAAPENTSGPQAAAEGAIDAESGQDRAGPRATPADAVEQPVPPEPPDAPEATEGERPGAEPPEDHPGGKHPGGKPPGGPDDVEPRVSRTMIVPIAATEPTPPDGPAGA